MLKEKGVQATGQYLQFLLIILLSLVVAQAVKIVLAVAVLAVCVAQSQQLVVAAI